MAAILWIAFEPILVHGPPIEHAGVVNDEGVVLGQLSRNVEFFRHCRIDHQIRILREVEGEGVDDLVGSLADGVDVVLMVEPSCIRELAFGIPIRSSVDGDLKAVLLIAIWREGDLHEVARDDKIAVPKLGGFCPKRRFKVFPAFKMDYFHDQALVAAIAFLKLAPKTFIRLIALARCAPSAPKSFKIVS